MSCLVIKNDGIGDLILCSGVLSELSKQFNGELDLVTCKANQEIAEMIPGIRHIYYVSRDNLRFARKGVHIPSINDEDKFILLQIALQKYTVAICLRRFIRQSSLIIMNCVTAKKKYCCWQIPTNATQEQAEKFSQGWIHYSGNRQILSELQYFWEFCSKVINSNVYAQPSLIFKNISNCVNHEEKKIAIGISEGSAKMVRGFWASLVELIAKQGWKVHLFGGANQSEFATFIKQLVPTVVNHTGELTITETLKFLGQFSYYIGNDTGLSHLASLIVPKILVVLGGGTFSRFFPWPSRPGQHVIFHGLDCYDCEWKCKYPSQYCLELLPSTVVLECFKKIVKGEKICRMINVGDPHISYQLSWRKSKKNSKKVKFDTIIKNKRMK